MAEQYPVYLKFDLGVYAKLMSQRKALIFHNGKGEISVQTQYDPDGVSEAYGEMLMGRGVEIEESEFNTEFGKLVDRLIALNL